MLLIAPITATGIVQKIHRNQMKAVQTALMALTVFQDLMVFFQI